MDGEYFCLNDGLLDRGRVSERQPEKEISEREEEREERNEGREGGRLMRVDGRDRSSSVTVSTR
jgi:hypothetical protein